MSATTTSAPGTGRPPGTAIVRFDLGGTLLFLVAGVLGLVSKHLRVVTLVASVVLFAAGVAVFLWSFFAAAERSRTDEIGVANLYLLTGETAVRPVKRAMLAALAVQVVGCLGFGAAGFSSLGVNEANLMAFAILVPVFGLGLNGLWAARHGAFGPRIVTAPAKRRGGVPPSDHDLEKNARHG